MHSNHHTKEKGDLAVFKAMADLSSKGYCIFTTITEHLPFDIVAYDPAQKKFYRIQVKYLNSKGRYIPSKTSWADKNGTHTKMYEQGDFDFYALYNPELDVVIYPSIEYRGKTIRFEIPNSPAKFYWYKDFLTFTSFAEKHSCKELGIAIVNKTTLPRINRRKVERPTKEELEILVWNYPTQKLALKFGVSDKAISKWCKSYNISKPPRGYWSKSPPLTKNL